MTEQELNAMLPPWLQIGPLDSETLMRLGFAFVAGLAMGAALRFALRITLVLVGLALLTVFVLEYQGLASIDWLRVEAEATGLMHRAADSAQSFFDFIETRIGDGASFLLGLYAGLRGAA